MKRIFINIVILLLQLQILVAGDGIRVQESISFFSKILKQEVKYSVCLPSGYFKTKKSYPVVYLLHGLGDDETSWLEYGRISQVADEYVKKSEIIPMIFIMPEGFRNYFVNDYAGTFLYQDMFIKELVPLIDSIYRTIADNQHRATLGYSMGGFGALVLPLKYPELFSVSVPLSISIRTDEQYKIEDASEWDQQWGRLFGGVGKTGQERITDYYKENGPFHIIENADLRKYKDLKAYIDNGDDEHTLCRSNEELHILMRKMSFPHEFRVRNGGHEFEYWREALPDVLRYLSDAFEGRNYRGDNQDKSLLKKVFPVELIEKKTYSIILPFEFKFTNRNYPVIYFAGDFKSEEKIEIGGLIRYWVETGSLSPVIIVFLNGELNENILREVIAETENRYRVRKGYRFRALNAFGKPGDDAVSLSLETLMFTSCAISNTKPDPKSIAKILTEKSKDKINKTWFYIENPDKGLNFAENGFLHIIFREADLYHEYRVREGAGGYEWFLNGLFDSLIFTQEKIHK
jgi:enterochelin esterase-like enzyme